MVIMYIKHVFNYVGNLLDTSFLTYQLKAKLNVACWLNEILIVVLITQKRLMQTVVIFFHELSQKNSFQSAHTTLTQKHTHKA